MHIKPFLNMMKWPRIWNRNSSRWKAWRIYVWACMCMCVTKRNDSQHIIWYSPMLRINSFCRNSSFSYIRRFIHNIRLHTIAYQRYTMCFIRFKWPLACAYIQNRRESGHHTTHQQHINYWWLQTEKERKNVRQNTYVVLEHALFCFVLICSG